MNIDLLFDNNTQWDTDKVALQDHVIKVLYTGTSTNIKEANDIITRLTDDPQFWLKTNIIMDNSKQKHTKFFILKHLEDTIQVKFRVCQENSDFSRSF